MCKWNSVDHYLPDEVIDLDGWDNREIDIRFDDGIESLSDVGTLLADTGMITHWKWIDKNRKES